MNRFILHPDDSRAQVQRNMIGFVQALPSDKAWQVEIKAYRKTRTSDQNAYLWGVVYKAFTDQLEGWDAEDVHEYLLGECFGWDRVEGLGRVKIKPIRRSSKLSTTEFAEYTEFCIRRGAQHGIFVPEPEPFR